MWLSNFDFIRTGPPWRQRHARHLHDWPKVRRYYRQVFNVPGTHLLDRGA